MNIQVHLTDNRLILGQTYEELAQQLKTGFLLIAYLKAELSLGEFAELMSMEYLEAREWLLGLGISMMREKAPELEQLMQENVQKFMQQRGLNMSE